MARFIVALCLVSTSAAVAFQAPATPETAVITGRVVNSQTGEPLRRVTLSLRSTTPPGTGATSLSFSQPPAAPYGATTDAEGKFRIEKIEPGTYRLSAERQGFLRQEYGPANVSGMGFGTPLHIAPGQELKDLEIKMVPHAVITGKVLDEEGEPMARVQLQAMRRRFIQGRHQLVPTGGGMTNDVGEFRIADLPPGRYWLTASYMGQMRMMVEGPNRNPDGKPEEDYIATYHPSSPDEAGARPIELQPGQQMPGIDIRMQKAQVFRVRGKVVGAENPRSIRLMLFPEKAGIGDRMMFMRGGAALKEDGTFEVGSVRPGSYVLTVLPAGPNTNALVGRTPVEVGRENVEGVVLTLAPPLTVNGRIQLPKDVKLDGLTNVRIQFTPIVSLPVNTPYASPRDDGQFSVTNVAPDRYRVVVFGLPKGAWLKSIVAGGQEILETGLDLSGGSAIPFEIVLGYGTGSVAGTAQDSKQQPISGAVVMAVPDPLQPSRYDLTRIAPADQRGQFTIGNLPPGNYRIYAWNSVEVSELQDPEILKAYESKAQRVTVRENGQEQLTLTAIVPDLTPR